MQDAGDILSLDSDGVVRLTWHVDPRRCRGLQRLDTRSSFPDDHTTLLRRHCTFTTARHSHLWFGRSSALSAAFPLSAATPRWSITARLMSWPTASYCTKVRVPGVLFPIFDLLEFFCNKVHITNYNGSVASNISFNIS